MKLKKKQIKLLNKDQKTLAAKQTQYVAGAYNSRRCYTELVMCGTTTCPSQHPECETLLCNTYWC
ncbi:hypothetical protein L1077_26625 [Pseudoalteromonas luteoviolacea]|uniref:Uncharacterized protein n=1 Tax=Pseudoalteromonas luteoviolacea H33 TaxID=1365251 RepID=A0A167FUE2_9GAMM|nr:hypothetical protein [Pseudoalteromonas luteoviolacea]KZN53000.1 hypothetical protein N476_09450 [Pseudoalteromonas luteoviolacea H33]KZN78083.1 hypothetical protein N477_10615 [Pseudoalteromonas luteoviolacea H33-S]MBQ4875713.1 hypothetical protein [Pseudoalteromonas luteoviolacea]MBQ4904748.1 hypothetical protein [Pseudoalteromonas luteoviolacea]MCF6443004.1 hypothetical protein [Pseudoalteromonas luteoviolacea]